MYIFYFLLQASLHNVSWGGDAPKYHAALFLNFFKLYFIYFSKIFLLYINSYEPITNHEAKTQIVLAQSLTMRLGPTLSDWQMATPSYPGR